MIELGFTWDFILLFFSVALLLSIAVVQDWLFEQSKSAEDLFCGVVGWVDLKSPKVCRLIFLPLPPLLFSWISSGLEMQTVSLFFNLDLHLNGLSSSCRVAQYFIVLFDLL